MDQDEKAYFLLDELFEGRARTLLDVEKAFQKAQIPSYREYLVNYGASVTRETYSGFHWAYRNPTQLNRVKHDEQAGIRVASLIRIHDGWIPRAAATAREAGHHETQRMQQAINRCFKDLGYYDVDGYVQFVGYELAEDDRDWFFEELIWIKENSKWPIDFEDAWREMSDVWRERIREGEARRCVELANMYQSTDVKAIFPVSS